MDTKHTPGPWVAVELAGDHGSYLIGAQPGHEQDGVLRLADTVRGRPAANAYLMAAAPNMLTALQAIASMRSDGHTAAPELLALCIAMAQIEVEKATREKLWG